MKITHWRNPGVVIEAKKTTKKRNGHTKRLGYKKPSEWDMVWYMAGVCVYVFGFFLSTVYPNTIVDAKSLPLYSNDNHGVCMRAKNEHLSAGIHQKEFEGMCKKEGVIINK